ncbi:MAG: hypothetical protein M3N08_02720 [Pseudomonadota bacterium]|nr:hypothetical protein [Pseudomonadota bacterium]
MAGNLWDKIASVDGAQDTLHLAAPNVENLLKRMPDDPQNTQTQEAGKKLQAAMTTQIAGMSVPNLRFLNKLNDGVSDSATRDKIAALAARDSGDPAALNRAVDEVIKHPENTKTIFAGIKLPEHATVAQASAASSHSSHAAPASPAAGKVATAPTPPKVATTQTGKVTAGAAVVAAAATDTVAASSDTGAASKTDAKTDPKTDPKTDATAAASTDAPAPKTGTNAGTKANEENDERRAGPKSLIGMIMAALVELQKDLQELSKVSPEGAKMVKDTVVGLAGFFGKAFGDTIPGLKNPEAMVAKMLEYDEPSAPAKPNATLSQTPSRGNAASLKTAYSPVSAEPVKPADKGVEVAAARTDAKATEPKTTEPKSAPLTIPYSTKPAAVTPVVVTPTNQQVAANKTPAPMQVTPRMPAPSMTMTQ